MAYTKDDLIALLKDNKKRLTKEIAESKELVHLIKKSATQDLSEDERSKMKAQLLDVFKSIPALAIFMLPGGMLLLPLAVKLIPGILPSAFSEPLNDEDAD